MKTTTLTQNDEPFISIAKGHISPFDFQQALVNEGWKNFEPIPNNEIRYEYWTVNDDDSFTPGFPNDNTSVPMTVHYWEGK